LYGDNKKAKNPGQLKDLDILVFDIQDVGVSFSIRIFSTLQYVMEACAEKQENL
jgi:uncharacterized protein YbbC (DUF1343 family)